MLLNRDTYVNDLCVNFATFCLQSELTATEGYDLMEQIGEALMATVGELADYAERKDAA